MKEIPYFELKEIQKVNQYFYFMLQQNDFWINKEKSLFDIVYWIHHPNHYLLIKQYSSSTTKVNHILQHLEKDYLKQLLEKLPHSLSYWKIFFSHPRLVWLLYSHHHSLFQQVNLPEFEPLWLDIGLLSIEKILVIDPSYEHIYRYIEASVVQKDKHKFEFWFGILKKHEQIYILTQLDLNWVLDNYSYEPFIYEEIIKANYMHPNILQKIFSQHQYIPTKKLLKELVKYPIPKPSLQIICDYVDTNIVYKLLRNTNKHLYYNTIFINRINDLQPLYKLEMNLLLGGFMKIMDIDVPIDKKVKKLFLNQLIHLKNNCSSEEIEMLKIKFLI